MPDSVGGAGFPRNINIGHEHLNLSDGFTYQYQGGVPTNALNWKIINGVTNTDPSTVGWSTNQLGASWFNSSERAYKYWDGIAVQTLDGMPYLLKTRYQRMAFIEDDFMSGGSTSGIAGALGWTLATGSASQTNGSVNGHPGVITRNTGVAIAIASTYLAFTTLLIQTWPFDMIFVTKYNTLDADTGGRVGMMASTTVPPVSGFYFEKLFADTNWFAVMRNSGNESRIDTGIPFSLGWEKFQIISTGAAAAYYIDDALVAQHSNPTFFPTVRLSPSHQVSSQVAADKTAEIDYFQLSVTNFGTRI